jgi:hypothetical protein
MRVAARLFGEGWQPPIAGWGRRAAAALLGPLLVVMMAVVTGARAIAGDEEAGSLELLLAHPVSRTRLLLERFGALTTAVCLLGLIVWAATVAVVAAADMGIGADRLAAATLGLVLLVLGFGTVALAAGAASGRRGLTLGVTAALAVTAYLANTVAPQVDSLKGSSNGRRSTTTWAATRCAPASTWATWPCWPPSRWSWWGWPCGGSTAATSRCDGSRLPHRLPRPPAHPRTRSQQPVA